MRNFNNIQICSGGGKQIHWWSVVFKCCIHRIFINNIVNHGVLIKIKTFRHYDIFNVSHSIQAQYRVHIYYDCYYFLYFGSPKLCQEPLLQVLATGPRVQYEGLKHNVVLWCSGSHRVIDHPNSSAVGSAQGNHLMLGQNQGRLHLRHIV